MPPRDDDAFGEEPEPRHHAPGQESDEPFEGARHLQSGTTREILVRLADGDPLGVMDIVHGLVLREALVLDAREVAYRTMAYMAYDAGEYGGDPPLAEWIAHQAGRALQALVNEDWEGERLGPPDEPLEERFVLMARLFGRPAARGRRLCTWFNDLPRDLRHPFFHVQVLGLDLSVYASRMRTVIEDVESRLAAALNELAERSEHDPGYQVHDLNDPLRGEEEDR